MGDSIGALKLVALRSDASGLALRGIRENAVRMPAIGAASASHLRRIYTLAASMAGVAGALLAETTSTVSLEVLSFQRSADVLVILILGGAGRLYGGIVGAIVYLVARDQLMISILKSIVVKHKRIGDCVYLFRRIAELHSDQDHSQH